MWDLFHAISKEAGLLENPAQETREDRYGKTQRKHVSLTTETVAVVQAYAERHGLYFSVAVESLLLLGLKQAPAETLPRLVTNLLERALNRQFNRFAKLIAFAAIAAEEVNYKTDVLLLQTIWREARLDPDAFVAKMQVSTDPQVQPDQLVRQIRDDICGDAYETAVSRLKKPMNEISALWQVEDNHE